jgi:hypothetical protein
MKQSVAYDIGAKLSPSLIDSGKVQDEAALGAGLVTSSGGSSR